APLWDSVANRDRDAYVEAEWESKHVRLGRELKSEVVFKILAPGVMAHRHH
ncbi:hypothetical protein AMECASPLE_028179, partial [Ameca splendens]